jgi:2-polyprenyl-3-methyl-5-hydroxy-6-metoxy-1,4-benzoquinol methylase
MLNEKQQLKGKLVYSEEFIKKLEEYATIGQNIQEEEALDTYIKEKQRHWDFSMDEYVKDQCEAVENANSRIIRFLERYMHLNGCNALDMGCGTGGYSVAVALKGAEVTAMDMDSNALEVAKLRAKEHGVKILFECHDAQNLPFTSNSFDIVICRQVLQHIPGEGKIKALKECFRVLKKGGLLYINTPNRCFPKDHHDTELWFVHWLPKKIALPYARMRGRYVPALHDYLSYSKLINTLTKEGEIQVLTNFLTYEDANDFYNHNRDKINKSFKYLIIFKILKMVSKFIAINRVLPIRIFIKKK